MEKLSQSFSKDKALDPRLKWTHVPLLVDQGITSLGRLTVGAAAESDAWKKTYYEPTIDKCNVPILGLEWIGDFSAQTRVRLNAMHQFDQAGLIVRYSADCWIKTGLEYVDGKVKPSVVVTNGYSDWTTHGTREATSDATLTVHKRGNKFVIEFGPEETDSSGSWWTFLIGGDTFKPQPQYFTRSCALKPASASQKPTVGLFVACPKEPGGTACFDYIIIKNLLKKEMPSEADLLTSVLVSQTAA
mmetsp:Transcript_8803/g.39114  ORF Transcript_8803/g.39114 Transcript_8803/m.39114 type:complete len:245 (-) Transcript_8803:197-931(-)|eukprot:CAMPEP_0113957498 /NCGR_PEP_ID=MMETSP0011_2-20120614/2815_1 /TAXON_ID=101924 /ORGANISM="Rhodosorus marinus" /LENGTH=244 /DNA_ID=CAMNT_0000968091 /DNA_START=65 /DNA_END=799 /DNA_ORIENTATION=+ /assembly_acc=CAM_ASM_000156